MKFFKMFQNPMTKEIKSIKVGVNWCAFLFGIFYLGYKKLWKPFGILLIITFINTMFISGLNDPGVIMVWIIISWLAGIGIAIFLAYKTNEWIVNDMVSRGWSYVKTVAGTNEEAVNLGQYQDLPNNQQPQTTQPNQQPQVQPAT